MMQNKENQRGIGQFHIQKRSTSIPKTRNRSKALEAEVHIDMNISHGKSIS